MNKGVQRLYRHFILIGVLMVAFCYLAIEFAHLRLSVFQEERLLNADAEISSMLILTGTDLQVKESHLNWFFSVDKPLPTEKIAALMSGYKWVQTADSSYGFSIVDEKGIPLVTGKTNTYKVFFNLEILLKRLLSSSQLAFSDKLDLLKSMSFFSVKPLYDLEVVQSEVLSTVHGLHGEYGFLWKDSESKSVFYVSFIHTTPVLLILVIGIIISIGVTGMLLLVWREFRTQDTEREVLENITRKIVHSSGEPAKHVDGKGSALKELAYSFDSMSSHIERLLKVQREMINAISHELRTPIARLRFGLEVMKDEVDESSESTVEALEGDVEELNVLVDEVLTYGKLESGVLELNFKEFSPYQLVDNILRHNHLLLQHLEVEVNIKQDFLVLGDEHHLSRAIQNLILNAAKYAAMKITVNFHWDAERWQLDIEDDGPGIAFEDRDKVFIPFQRLDNSRTRASGGYGLGLAIVQRIAFWHGGAVLVDASDSGGAKFSFIWSRSQHQKTLS